MASTPHDPVPGPRLWNAELDPVAADDRLVEDVRRGRLGPDHPDRLVRLLVELAARCSGDRRGSGWAGTADGAPGWAARRGAPPGG